MTAPQIVKGQDLWGPCPALSHLLRGASSEGGSGRGGGTQMGPKLFLGLCRVTGTARARDGVLGETGGKGSEKVWVPA